MSLSSFFSTVSSYNRLVLPIILITLPPLVFGQAMQSENRAKADQQEAIKKVEQVVIGLLRDGSPDSSLAVFQQAAKDLSISQETFLRLNQPEAVALGAYYLGIVQEIQATWQNTYDRYRPAYDLARDSKAPLQKNGIFVEFATFEEYGVRGYAAVGLRLKRNSYEMLRTSWRDARDAYVRAYEFASRARHNLYKAMALIGLARVENWGLRDYGAASAHINEAVELLNNSNNRPYLYIALEVKTEIQENFGQFNEARLTSTQALDVASSLADQITLCFALFNRATITYRQLNPAKGLSDCAKFGVENCTEAANQADQDYQQALAITETVPLSYLATPLKIGRQLLRVRIQGFQAFARKTSSMDKPLTYQSMGIASGINLDPETRKKMDMFFKEIAGGTLDQLMTATNKINDPMLADPALSYKWQADALRYINNNPNVALTQYKKAVEALESQRGNLGNISDRINFQAARVSIYQEAFLLLAAQSKWTEAFELTEKARSRVLADLIQGKDRATENRQGPLSAMNFSLTAPWAISTNRSVNAQGNGQRGMTARLTISNQVSLNELQQSMQRDKYEVLYYSAMPSGMAIWHINSDSSTAYITYLWGKSLFNAISTLQNSLKNTGTKFDEATARKLYDILIAPMQTQITGDNLVIIPNSDLSNLPFQALQMPDGKFLGERYNISYAPSATVLLGLKRGENIAVGKLLAIADDNTLPESSKEVRAISSLYPNSNRLFIKPLAKESEIKPLVANYDIIHFSVHGVFNDESETDPLLAAYLKLSGSESDNGKLTAKEMFDLPLAKAKLVVLSACESGKAEVSAADEFTGMVSALLYAGANNLILTSWKVDEVSTRIWMETFYRAAKSQPLAVAARVALTAVKSDPRFSHPYHWGAFLLIGR